MVGTALFTLALFSHAILPSHALPLDGDPCARVGGRPFVIPSEALACFKSFPFNETLRQNILTNVARVLDFFTFEEFYRDSPPPFEDSTVNIRAEISRINTTHYEVHAYLPPPLKFVTHRRP